MMRTSCSVSCLVLALTVLIPTGASNIAEPVPAMISDEPIDLKGASSPTLVSGRTFVPVRPIAEMLGADLDWDSSSKTLTVSGGSGTGIIRLGSRLGTIKGTNVYFPSEPFLYGGHVFAPIIFFNELFDMALVWDPYRQIFKWEPIVPVRPYSRPPVVIRGPTPRANEAEAPATPTSNLVVGEAIRALPSRKDPKISIQVAGKRVVYRITREAIIIRGPLGARAVEVPLGEIRPGDRVILQLNDEGVVTAIRAQYRQVKGTVQSAEEHTILLDSGQTLRVTSRTQIVLPGNISGQLEDIRPGDSVVARVAPVSGKAYVIDVVSPASSDKEEEDPITLNTVGPLRTDDVLVITFRGRANGTAKYTIPGVKTDAPMLEVEPGVYQGEYTIQQGDLLPRQPVRVTFTEPDGEMYSLLSRHRVTIAASGRYLPRIVSPRQGEIIDSPIVVTGVAEPGSIVRVTVEYRKDVQGMLPLEGLTAMEVVRADSEGIFETPPMAAAAPFEERKTKVPSDFDEYPTVYVVTARALGADGRELAAYSIETVKGRGERLEGLVPGKGEPRGGLVADLGMRVGP